MANETKLKPCPFCGEEASPNGRIMHSSNPDCHWSDTGEEVLEEFYSNCMSCSCRTAGYRTKELAIAAWNTRVALTPRQEAADEMYAALDRALTLLNATARFIAKNPVQEYLVHYDEADCDGACLRDDCQIEVAEIIAALRKAGRK